MAVVIRCDACDGQLGREVFGVTLTPGSLVAGAQSDPRFVPDEHPSELVLCRPCAEYVDAAAGELARAARGDRP
ncbi:MAG: hypothetical protein CVU47_00870 [Chloroflexi bacterium HGW-Chloroflexi-9]|nr:MAG: hypothetical protein CVU47_00870 [Chloroflexi bacterium HGW-Chloroflexi-9]